jgi:CBS domain-containing membrane protein
MFTIDKLMTRDLVTLRDDDTLDDADWILARKHIRHLPVVRGKKLVGLLTHRDLLRHFGRKGTPGSVRVKDAMTSDVTTLRPDASLLEGIRLMLANRYGCLPVTTPDGTLVGIVTESDLLRVAAARVEEIDRRELAADYD